jgi:hypothetical protein
MRWKVNSSPYIFFIFLVLTISQANHSAFAENPSPYTTVIADATQKLVVHVYGGNRGEAQNISMGTYVIGNLVKFYVHISMNSTAQEMIVTPNGTEWIRMKGPIEAGTFVDYFQTQYPTGKWAILVSAKTGNQTASDIAPFEVVDKQPYTCTRTNLIGTPGNVGETKFTGRVVKTYVYPVGGVHSWDVQVDHVYFGSDIRNQTVYVQILAITYTLGHPPGYLDENITLGDEVAVYGLLNGQSVNVNGSVNYYVERLALLCEQPQVTTPQTGSDENAARTGEAALIIILLILALMVLRAKYSRGSKPTPSSISREMIEVRDPIFPQIAELSRSGVVVRLGGH